MRELKVLLDGFIRSALKYIACGFLCVVLLPCLAHRTPYRDDGRLDKHILMSFQPRMRATMRICIASRRADKGRNEESGELKDFRRRGNQHHFLPYPERNIGFCHSHSVRRSVDSLVWYRVAP